MSNEQEQAVEKFTSALLEIMDRQSNATAAEKHKSFISAARAAAATLTKEEIIDILFFVIQDHELFFDVFGLSVSRSDASARRA